MIPTSRAATAAESVIFGSTPETADLARIAEHSGTPVHVLFEQLLRDRYLALRRVLAAAESVRLYHSVKANFETRVLATLRAAGCGAERLAIAAHTVVLRRRSVLPAVLALEARRTLVAGAGVMFGRVHGVKPPWALVDASAAPHAQD